MEGCQEIQLNFTNGYYSTSDCHIVDSSISSRSTTSYINLTNLTFNRNQSTGGANLVLCKYDPHDNLVDISVINANTLPVGENSLSLDGNYKYKFSFRTSHFGNFHAYNCNKAIASMSNELAFGSGSSLFSSVSTLTPLFITLIGFALGFWFLKNIVRKGQKGKTL